MAVAASFLTEMKITITEETDTQTGSTKANPTELFKYLRDCMNGYAAALLHNPQRQMPLECMTLPELRSMLGDLEQQDKAKVAKAAEKAAAKRHKTK